MAEAKTYLAIGGSVIGVAIIALIVALNYNVTGNSFYCPDKPANLLDCTGGLSTGLHTRCYLNENKTTWSNCASGWLKVTDYVNITTTINETTVMSKTGYYNDGKIEGTFEPYNMVCHNRLCIFTVTYKDLVNPKICNDLSKTSSYVNKDGSSLTTATSIKSTKTCEDSNIVTFQDSFIAPTDSGEMTYCHLFDDGVTRCFDPTWTSSNASTWLGTFNQTGLNPLSQLSLSNGKHLNDSDTLFLARFDNSNLTEDGDKATARYLSISYQDGRFAQALNLSAGDFSYNSTGVDGRMNIMLNESGTIEFWAKPDNILDGIGSPILFYAWNGTANSNGIEMYRNTNTGTLTVIGNNATGTTANLVMTNVFQSNTWVHIAVTWNDTNTSAYVNGVLKASTRGGRRTGGSPAVFQIGFSTYYWKGLVDDFRISNRTRTATEIFLDYNLSYNTNGTYYSEVYDPGIETNWSALSVNSITASDYSTANISWRSCANSDCSDGTFTAAEQLNLSQNTYNLTVGYLRYFQYYVQFNSNFTNMSHAVINVSIDFLRNFSQGVPLLNATSSSNTTADNLTVYNQSTYGLNVTNYYSWFKNGNDTLRHINDSNTTFLARFDTDNRSIDGHSAITGVGTPNFVNGKFGNGVNFTGLNNLVYNTSDNAGYNLFNKTNVTVEFWFKQNWNSVDGQRHNYFSYFASSTNQLLFWKHSANNYTYLQMDGLNCISYLQPTLAGQWTHMAFTATNGSFIVYINGVQKSTATCYYLKDQAPGLFTVGDYGSQGNANGTMDDLRIYNRVRTAEEIAYDYNWSNQNYVDSSNLTVGDTWQSCIQATDIGGQTNTSCSNSLTINSVIPPVAPNLTNISAEEYGIDYLKINCSAINMTGTIINYTMYLGSQGVTTSTCVNIFEGLNPSTSYNVSILITASDISINYTNNATFTTLSTSSKNVTLQGSLDARKTTGIYNLWKLTMVSPNGSLYTCRVNNTAGFVCQ